MGDQRMPSRIVKKLTFQLFRGLDFVHSKRIIHRDIKPSNLLLNQELQLKICDFGLSRAFSLPVPKYTHEVVTVWYRAPEILLGSGRYGLPIDVWSAFCVFGEMATGTPLFGGDSEIDTLFRIFQKFGTPTPAEWPGLNDLPCFKSTFPKWSRRPWSTIRTTAKQVGSYGIDLLEKGMLYDPPKRISMRGALDHLYFGDVDR